MKQRYKKHAPKQAETPSFQIPSQGDQDPRLQVYRGKNSTSAQLAFKKLARLDSTDINARYVYAMLIDDGSHKKRAEARDMMLSNSRPVPGNPEPADRS